MIRAGPGFDADATLALGRLARILQDVDQSLGQVIALHQQRRQVHRAIHLHLRLILGSRRKHLLHRSLDLLGDIQSLDFPFGQLRVTHQFGDDVVRPLHLFTDDLQLLQTIAPAVTNRLLKRERRIVDDRERVFDLVRNLRRQPSC